MREPIWILPEVVMAIHARQIQEHGGRKGVRDQNLLHSALAAPQNLYQYGQASLSQLAAAYAHSICQNHPFIDGNKRTAYICMRLFLQLNENDIQASQEEKIQVMLQVAQGSMPRNTLASWIEQHLTGSTPEQT